MMLRCWLSSSDSKVWHFVLRFVSNALVQDIKCVIVSWGYTSGIPSGSHCVVTEDWKQISYGSDEVVPFGHHNYTVANRFSVARVSKQFWLRIQELNSVWYMFGMISHCELVTMFAMTNLMKVATGDSVMSTVEPVRASSCMMKKHICKERQRAFLLSKEVGGWLHLQVIKNAQWGVNAWMYWPMQLCECHIHCS